MIPHSGCPARILLHRDRSGHRRPGTVGCARRVGEVPAGVSRGQHSGGVPEQPSATCRRSAHRCWCSTTAPWTATSRSWPPGAPTTAWGSLRTGRRRWRRRCGSASWRRAPGASPWPTSASCGSPPRSASAGCMLANALVDPNGLTWAARLLADRRRPPCWCGPTHVDTVAAMDRGARRRGSDPPDRRAGRTRWRRRAHRGTQHRGGRPDRRRGRGERRTCDWPAWPDTRVRSPTTHRPEPSPRYATTCARLAEFHRGLLAAGTYQTDEIIVTAGGSAYFDDVAEVLGELATEGGGTRPRSACWCARAPTSSTTTASTGPSRRCRGPVRHCARRCTPGPGSSPARSPASRCWTPASVTSRSTRDCPSRSWSPTTSGPRPTPLTGAHVSRGQRPARVPADPRRQHAAGRPGRPAGPVPSVHRVRQVALDPGRPARLGAAPRPIRSSSTWSGPTSDATGATATAGPARPH